MALPPGFKLEESDEDQPQINLPPGFKLEEQPEEKQPSNIALPAELGLIGGAGATAYQVGDIGLKGTRNVVRKVEQLLENIKKPETISAPAPTEFAGAKTPVDKYGKAMHGGVYSHTQDMSQMYEAGKEAQAFKAANPAWEVRQGSSIALPPDLKAAAAAAKKPPVPTGIMAKAQQIAEPVVSGVKSLGAPLKFAGKFLAPIAGAFEAGTQGGEAYNRGETGDTTGAIISGLGALGSAGMMSGNPLIAVPGAAVSIAAPQINKYRDLVKQGRIKHEAPNYQNIDAMGNAYAHGGAVHLADGGTPETGPFIGYPHIKNKPNDPNFVQQSGPILGGLDAILGIGKRDDVSMLTPQGQAYHEAYDKLEPVGIAGNILPFMGGPTKAVGKSLAPKAAEMAENYLTKIGGIQHIVPPSKTSVTSSTIGEAFDPRFDKRVGEQNKLKSLTTHTENYQNQNVPTVSLVDYEGRPFITSMADRSAAGDYLLGVNDVQFKRAIDRLGGQDYMFNNPGQVWASAKGPVKQLMEHASIVKDLTGQNPLYVPWRMAPSGSDFAHMTGETMLAHAESAMDRTGKKALDSTIKGFIPDWKGVDNPASVEQFRNAPSPVRKAIQNTMDKNFRDIGGLGIGEARLAIADPKQLTGKEGQIMNIGEIFADKPTIAQSGHPSYPLGVPGQGLGRIDTPRNIAELLPKFARDRGMPNPTTLRPEDRRALEMKPYSGIIDDKLLKSLGYATGGKVLSTLGKSLGEAQAAYKAKFTPGFYHGSPSPNIKAFDPTKGDRAFPTEGVTFVTRDPDFADSFLGMNRKGEYEKGSTVYPVNVNLGKHFVPGSKEGSALIDEYVKRLPVTQFSAIDNAEKAKHLKKGAWEVMEDPNFLQYLKDTGHNTFTVMEGGTPNVGVFNPADIRGKFAKYNPEDAASPDFMKAEGGPVEHLAGGGSALSKMASIAKDLALPAAENAARTQIIGTLPTYGKAAEMLAQRGATGQAIDFGAGLGKGAELLGPGTHTYEPFAQNWTPTFSNAKDIPSDAYNRLTNLNVLNVVPREARDEIVQNIGRVMEPGGQGIITTRGADVMKAQGRPGPEPTSIITSRDTYQKGFSKQELEDYLKYMLGEKFDVNRVNLGPAGVHIQKKAAGGEVLGGLGALLKKALPLAEREANKAKFLAGTKAIDVEGKPLTLYHGTSVDEDFDAFKKKPRWIHVSEHPEAANAYTQPGNDQLAWGQSPRVLPLHLNTKNPLILDEDQLTEGSFLPFKQRQREWIELAKQQGNDSIYNPRTGTWMVPEPNQLKSAIGNQGTFDPNTRSLTKKKGGKV